MYHNIAGAAHHGATIKSNGLGIGHIWVVPTGLDKAEQQRHTLSDDCDGANACEHMICMPWLRELRGWRWLRMLWGCQGEACGMVMVATTAMAVETARVDKAA